MKILKNMKFNILMLSLFTVIGCGSDDNVSTIINPSGESFTSLQELVESLKPPFQTYEIDPTMDQTIVGEDGTEITISAGTCVDDNNDPITSPITVHLREHLTLEDMILSNVQTSSNHQLLVTGGSFNLSFQDENGNSVNANSNGLQAKIPVQTDITGYENSMQYYRGSTTTVDNREIVDWNIEGNAEIWFDNEGDFNIFGLEEGLTNCDALYDMVGANPTQFEVMIDGATDLSNATTWLIVNDFPSVVMIYSFNDSETAFETYANSIPVGLQATLLSIYIDADHYLQFGSLPITVTGDDVFTVEVDYGTSEDLITLVQSLTN